MENEKQEFIFAFSSNRKILFFPPCCHFSFSHFFSFSFKINFAFKLSICHRLKIFGDILTPENKNFTPHHPSLRGKATKIKLNIPDNCKAASSCFDAINNLRVEIKQKIYAILLLAFHIAHNKLHISSFSLFALPLCQ